MLIMTIIKRREDALASLQWAALNELQKGWVFVGMLAPGLGAQLLTRLKPEERDSVLVAGKELSGSARAVALPVLEVFFKQSGLAKGLPGKDVEEVCRWLNLRFAEEPEELVSLYRKAYLQG